MKMGLRVADYVSHKIFQTETRALRRRFVPVALTNRRKDGARAHPVWNDQLIATAASNDRRPPSVYVNACPHRQSQLLTQPVTNTKAIRCPYHNWVFSCEDGSCKKTTGFNSTRAFREQHALRRMTSSTAANVLMFQAAGATTSSFAPAPPTFPEFETSMTEDCAADHIVVRERSWAVEANYKLLIENFLEYYHLHAVHPTLVGASPPEHHLRSPSSKGHVAFETNPAEFANSPLARFSASPNPRYQFHVLFPNYFAFVHDTHSFCVFVTPVSPTRSVEKAYLLMAEDYADDDAAADEVWDFYQQVNQEDVDIVERVQRGLTATHAMGHGDHRMRLLPYWDQHVSEYVQEILDMEETDGEEADRVESGTYTAR